ncbi:MAG: glutamine--fructose-6-phosphate transaminase (isomerizing) [Ruminococcus sp.]|jgi:glucosamine--fructose-6-phosphate aminotransferase (isomerizing)|nr:glutamine--fructose-6-phosphate transaminase (isomerizing) [Ruminococcus sp.]
MCGIVGFTGQKPCVDILIESLKRLEYRGYDSAGIAVFENGSIRTAKAKGKINEGLVPLINRGADNLYSTDFSHQTCGIGHTRWATHGEPSDVNSHPIGNGRVTIVHNGIIENYREIKEFLIGAGYSFESETDTETVVKLLDYYYDGDPVEAIIKVCAEIKGAYALGILFRGFPDTIYAVKKESPLIVGDGKTGNFIASDVAAIMEYTKDYYLLEAGEIAVIRPDSINFLDIHRRHVEKKLKTVDWDISAAKKGGYEHFMLKEIHEQPSVLASSMAVRIKGGLPDFSDCGLSPEKINSYNKFFIVGCGSAMHAGIVGKSLLEGLGRVPVTVDIASEWRYSDPLIDENDLCIVISQSGETADTLAALKLAKERGADTLAVVNVVGSTIARAADMVIYMSAGPEISVCSTKAYAVQVEMMYLIAFAVTFAKGKITEEKCREYTAELQKLPELVSKLLEDKADYQYAASHIMSAESLLYIGRGLDYALSMEGSLKLKEISYIHSESYAAGELKHGTISLITEDTPVIAVATQTALLDKTISNIKEVKARGAKVVLVTRAAQTIDEKAYDIRVNLPEALDIFMPIITCVPLQLIAYYTAVLRGTDVDMPRNLAKSVTVE